jgi:hypothetical protein
MSDKRKDAATMSIPDAPKELGVGRNQEKGEVECLD